MNLTNIGGINYPQRSQSLNRKDVMGTLLFQPNPHCDSYISPRSRFQKDFAYYDKIQRQKDRVKKEEKYERKRISQMVKENNKAMRLEDSLQKETIRLNNKRKHLEKSLVNARTMGINPVTLEYYPNHKGGILREKENKSIIKSMIRAKNLELQNGVGFNIINGKATNHVHVPKDILDLFGKDIRIPNRSYRIFNKY